MADLSGLGEFGLIELIRQSVKPARPWVDTGIGDDCAVLKLSESERLLVTTDMLIDRVHFLKDRITPWQLGFKSMAVNLSDIAAMGGEPQAAFLAVGLTPEIEREYFSALRDGLLACAARHAVDLLGGDTVVSRTDLVLCLTVLGTARADQVIRRAGAKPGDRLLLGGTVGDSAAGLRLLCSPPAALGEQDRAQLLRAHLEPQPQVALGRLLASRHLATAMIDVSDGLLQDLSHLCEEGAVGADLDADALPISEAAKKLAIFSGLDARDWALSGGEDYVLLFTVPPQREAECRQACREQLNLDPTPVGSIRAGRGLRVRCDGVWKETGPAGYDAFREGLVER